MLVERIRHPSSVHPIVKSDPSVTCALETYIEQTETNAPALLQNQNTTPVDSIRCHYNGTVGSVAWTGGQEGGNRES